MERILRYPFTMIGSDGEVPVFGQAAPHPRSYGTFARVLGRYVREKHIITLEDAVARMTGADRARLQLFDRGLLRPGMKADMAIFDPAAVADKATFEQPHQYAEGVLHVIVNGQAGAAGRQNDAGAAGPGALRSGQTIARSYSALNSKVSVLVRTTTRPGPSCFPSLKKILRRQWIPRAPASSAPARLQRPPPPLSAWRMRRTPVPPAAAARIR